MTDYKYTSVAVETPNGEDEFYFETTKNLVLNDMLRYPNNSIIHKATYEKFLNNIHRIPIDALERFLDDHNCI